MGFRTARQPPRDSSSGSSRDHSETRVHRHEEERILKIAAMIATAEARCTSEVLARRAVEAIGKVRIEEWICEDFVRNTRKHRDPRQG
jgi:predicted SAM-dependent methyltransferase